ncbi:MAG: hypothetical protein KYX62_14135 [Pseudomonadota bacterium]|nr:hypothetical protein [Pseudomonadota bacterium]
MSDRSDIPSPLQVLAQIDQALEAAGLKESRSERQPVPLFRQLLQEWLVSEGLAISDDATPLAVLCSDDGLPYEQSVAAVEDCFHETCSLCRAHGTLTEWTQKELENEYRQLLAQLQQPQSPQPDAGGY